MKETPSVSMSRVTNDRELSERYSAEIRRYKLLTASEEVDLGRRVRAGDGAARERLIAANLRLVVKLAHGYAGFGMSFEDLVAEGNVGLIRAADRFDPERGVRFGSYASLWIRQAMRAALSERSRTVRLPSHILEKSFKINAATMRLSRSLGREPTESEIGSAVGFPAARVRIVKAAVRPVRSLDEPAEPGFSEVEFIAKLVDEASPRPDKAAIDDDLRACLMRLLARLDRRERSILISRFGLDGRDPQTLDQVGDRIGLTRERVRQIQNVAIESLRKGFTALDGGPPHGRQPRPQTTRLPSRASNSCAMNMMSA
jgi:RNA polymerase primary sigma factor